MEIRRTVRLPEWNGSVWQRIVEYWRGRGVALQRLDDGRLVGRRGSVWGNLSSLHIAKVLTTVTVTRTDQAVECVLDVDPRYRSITKLNRTYLELELALFEAYLLTGELHPEAWVEHRRAAIKTRGELMATAHRHLYTGRGPMVIGGDLRLKAWMILLFAVALPPAALHWGPMMDQIFGALIIGRSAHHGPRLALFGPIMAAVFPLLFGGLGLWMLKLRKESAKCLDAEQAATRLGIDADLMRSAIQNRRIEPRFILDGEPVYDLDDLTGAARLLRPAETPTADGLLRPAVTSSTHANEHMLRPADLDLETRQATQSQRSNA